MEWTQIYWSVVGGGGGGTRKLKVMTSQPDAGPNGWIVLLHLFDRKDQNKAKNGPDFLSLTFFNRLQFVFCGQFY